MAKQADEITLQQADVVLVLEQEDGEHAGAGPGWWRDVGGVDPRGIGQRPRKCLEHTRCGQLTLSLAPQKRFLCLLMGGLIRGPSAPSLKDLFKRP